VDNSADLDQFAVDLQQDIIAAAELDAEEALRADTFTARLVEELTEAGELDDGHVCYHRARGVEVSGYSVNEDERCLDLFVTLFRQETPPPTVQKSDVESAFRRLENFLVKACTEGQRRLEEASPIFDMVSRIYELREDLERVRFFLFTDGLTTLEFKGPATVHDLPVSYHIWDIRRLFRCVTSGQRHEAISIDFMGQFNQAIPCLRLPEDADLYDAYLAVFPAQVLYEIYAMYGPRLLELNVRSFLQARGKVNKGIKRTIIEEPERFLAYNNGISATASEVELLQLPDGGVGIGRVSDFQIVNGGQTTASIYHAVKSDGADVSAIHVQAKLTVIDRSNVPEIVPLISRYANSQNKINEADFSANDPFHVRLEELSRTVWAPASDGTQRQSRWFYERARGQYQDALAREFTPARKRKFKAANPTSQRFTKTDLAKFEGTWDQLPHLVSRGAEKNFREFTIRLSNRGRFQPDQAYFQRLVAKAILFRRTEKLVSSLQFGGYRANIVTYSIAYLVNKTASRVDLDLIWKHQDLSASLSEALTAIAVEVHNSITNPPGGRNVTEWCKNPACWEVVQKLDVELPAELESELISVAPSKRRSADRGIETPTPEEEAVIQQVSEVASEIWFQLSKWAKETERLQPWQRGLAYSLGRLAKNEKPPSRKQAVQGLKIMEEARRLGFQPEKVEASSSR
jgi:hypothetical protein